ncbi:sodium:solute symporter [Mycobacterium sp. djl-10]|nr:sodium:solute symporter [Mycobacterium sp. djl-10]
MAEMTGSMVITLGLLALFFALIVVVLYATNRNAKSFSDYAVGGRSFGSWYIAMSYTNSWWPGATYTAFFGLSVSAGVLGFYALAYSLLGVTAMYLMAERAWLWGKRYDLRTQPDMMGLRFDSQAVRVIASLIGVVCLFPWIVLGMQAMGLIFRFASFGQWSVTTCLVVGVAVIAVRQIWTVQMGMRGLVITDLVQGIVAYGLAAAVCLGILFGPRDSAGFGALRELPETLLSVPGDGGRYGSWYLFSLVLTGVIGSLCWPTSYQRIYTAKGVRSVKKGTLHTMWIAGGFYALLTLVALSAASMTDIVAAPQDGWFTLLYDRGGVWLLGLALVIVLAASMGWIDGCVQVCGAQIANDIVHVLSPRTDFQLKVVAKGSMVVYMLAAAVVAYVAFDYPRLQLLAQMSYQGIVQLAVPMFLGLFWKRGTKAAALSSMTVGFLTAAALTYLYPDDIAGLGSLTSGVVALAANLVVYLAVSIAAPQSDSERRRVNELFAAGRSHRIPSAATAAEH